MYIYEIREPVNGESGIRGGEHMGAYGTYLTRFQHISNQQLFHLYRYENWSCLKEAEKLDLYQETVNRHAAALGVKGAPMVQLEDMGPFTAGCHADGVISLNKKMLIDGMQAETIDDMVIFYERDDANLQAMMTCFHETYHAWQDQCLDGTISCSSEELLKQYQANDFNLSAVRDTDGLIKVGSQYISGIRDENYFLYYLQSTERDAHRKSEMLTLHVMEQLEQAYGTEDSFQAFREDVEINGYDTTLERAKEFYLNPNVEKDINRTLMNAYYGENVDVDPITEAAVEKAMIQSFEDRYLERNRLDHTYTYENEYTNGMEYGGSN